MRHQYPIGNTDAAVLRMSNQKRKWAMATWSMRTVPFFHGTRLLAPQPQRIVCVTTVPEGDIQSAGEPPIPERRPILSNLRERQETILVSQWLHLMEQLLQVGNQHDGPNPR